MTRFELDFFSIRVADDGSTLAVLMHDWTTGELVLKRVISGPVQKGMADQFRKMADEFEKLEAGQG